VTEQKYVRIRVDSEVAEDLARLAEKTGKSVDELAMMAVKNWQKLKRGEGGYKLMQRLSEYVTRCPYCGKEILIPTYRADPITLEEHREQFREELKRIKQLNRGEKDE